LLLPLSLELPEPVVADGPCELELPADHVVVAPRFAEELAVPVVVPPFAPVWLLLFDPAPPLPAARTTAKSLNAVLVWVSIFTFAAVLPPELVAVAPFWPDVEPLVALGLLLLVVLPPLFVTEFWFVELLVTLLPTFPLAS